MNKQLEETVFFARADVLRQKQRRADEMPCLWRKSGREARQRNRRPDERVHPASTC